jgi:hypothetical protein
MEFIAINVITFIAGERGGGERMTKRENEFKRDYAGIYDYKRYERESALNEIRMEFMAINVTR